MTADRLDIAKKSPTLSLSQYIVKDILTSDWSWVICTVVADSSSRKQRLYAGEASGNLQ